jgi:hypothetical protein
MMATACRRHLHSYFPSFLCATLLLLLAALLVAPFSGAQSTGGRVRGTVTDPSGGAVAAVSVQLVNEATHATRQVQSNENGEYIFIEVPVGSYEIDVNQQGFKKYLRKGIPVNLNEVIGVDIVLQIGGSTETVEVTGAPPVVDTTSTQLGAIVNERSSKELPLNERDAYQLLQLQPGVQSQIGNDLFYGSDKAGVVTVNGGRGRSNNYSVNGGDGNDLFANLPAVQPSPDSIEEFRVITNSFDAEYGRNSGAVVNVVTKSGTNNLHGSTYEFFRNDVLNAHGFSFSPTPKAPFKQNQFGGTLGGPIKKDKTFFFGSYEGRRIVRGIVSQPVPVPTPGEVNSGDYNSPGSGAPINFSGTLNDSTVANIFENRAGCRGALPATAMVNLTGTPQTVTPRANLDAAAAGTAQPYAVVFANGVIPTQCYDPVALSLLGFLPKGAINSSGTFQDVVKSRDSGDQAQGRLDHEINKNQKLSVYYYYNRDNVLDPFAKFQQAGSALGNFPGTIVVHTQQINASHNWTIGSTSVNEFRFTLFREASPQFYTPTNNNAITASCGSPVASALCFGGSSDTPLVSDSGTALGATPACPGFGCGIHPGLGSKFEGVPFIFLNGTTGFLGNNFEGQLPQTGNTFQFTDNFSKIVGNHSFKFGGDFRYQKLDQKVFFNVNGEFIIQAGGNNDVGAPDLFADYLLGLPATYAQGSANTEIVRSKAVYLFAQDSWKIRPSLTLNYGLRWELNTPLTDTGKKVQTFHPGQVSTVYPCQLSAPSIAAFQQLPQFSGAGAPTPDCLNTGTTPTGLVVPGDKGVPDGLYNNYTKAFAPRLGLNWSPGWKDGMLAKLTGGPNKTTVSMGWGLFYNPIEQLVLEQFVAEPPFGISNNVNNPLFSTPFVDQAGNIKPNVSNGFLSPPRNQGVDWSLYRPILLFGQFPANLRTQYSAQYNLTIKRELPGNILFQIGYVGSQGHRLLASHDLNPGNGQTCIDLMNLANANPANVLSPSGTPVSCGPLGEDAAYTIPAGTTIPAGGFHLPYNAGSGGLVVPAGTLASPITLVGLRPFSAPNCQPLNSNPLTNGCPADGNVTFTNIFSEDSAAKSNYNSLQALFEKRFSHGLQFQASYTFAKSLDNASSFEEVLNPFNFNSSYSPSLFDARHRFVFNFVWELPVPKYQGFKGKLLDGWEISGIITYQTGFPILIQTTADNDLQGEIQGFVGIGRPNFVAPYHSVDFHSTVCAFGTGPLSGTGTPCQPISGQVFDPNLFDNTNPASSVVGPNPVALGTLGNVPRTICCNPPINNWDMGFFKDTPIGEKLRLQFRTEVFNIFNRAQPYSVDGNVGNQGSTFGQPQKFRDPRLIQFALKLVF